MLVTINTDASYSPQYNIAAYAFWVSSNRFRLQKSGVFKDLCNNSTEAESMCIINALHVILLGHSGISKVIVNTDSRHSITILGHGKGNYKWRKFRAAYHKILRQNKNKCKIEFRHVKAHSGTDTPRKYVNDWCDKEAKKQMRLAVRNRKINLKYLE